MGDLEHALMYFHKVKRKTKGSNQSAEIGIQRCLEAVKYEVNNIGQIANTEKIKLRQKPRRSFDKDKIFLKVLLNIFCNILIF